MCAGPVYLGTVFSKLIVPDSYTLEIAHALTKGHRTTEVECPTGGDFAGY